MLRHKSQNSGFTIVELLIATTVFSVVLLGAVAGFMEIGREFYKGVTVTNTQAVANQVFQDVSGQFQTAATFTKVISCQQDSAHPCAGGQTNTFPTDASQGTAYSYFCIGNSRYTYNIASSGSNIVSFSSTPNHAPGGNFGILKDTLAGGSGCSTPCGDTSGAPSCTSKEVKLNNPVELLGDNMRLSAFYIDQTSNTSNVYNVKIIVAYGQDDVFSDNPPQNPATIACASDAATSQYCSVSTITSAVFRGWNQ